MTSHDDKWAETAVRAFEFVSPGATPEALETGMAALGRRFPDDHAAFLLLSNGAELGGANRACAILWDIDRIVEHQRSYMAEWWPAFVAIGSNGAGEMMAFDTRRTPCGVAIVPYLGDVRDAVDRAPSFRALIDSLIEGGGLFPPGFGGPELSPLGE